MGLCEWWVIKRTMMQIKSTRDISVEILISKNIVFVGRCVYERNSRKLLIVVGLRMCSEGSDFLCHKQNDNLL